MKSSFQLATYLRQCLGLVLVLPIVLVGGIYTPAHRADAQVQTADNNALTLRSDVQEANSQTGVVTARGNVQIDYPSRQIKATAAQAQYFSREARIVLTGNVYVLQEGNSLRGENITYLINEGRFVALPKAERQVESIYIVSDPVTPTEPTAPSLNPESAVETPTNQP